MHSKVVEVKVRLNGEDKSGEHSSWDRGSHGATCGNVTQGNTSSEFSSCFPSIVRDRYIFTLTSFDAYIENLPVLFFVLTRVSL